MKNATLLTTVLLLFFLACKKDKIIDPEPETPVLIDTPKAEISYGVYSNMVVKNYGYTLYTEYNRPPSTFLLDLDDDGVNDIRFTDINWGSPGLGQRKETSIHSLNPDVQLFGYVQPDSIFKNTIINSTTTSPDGSVRISMTKYHTCKALEANDTLVSFNPDKFHLIYQDQHFKLTEQGVFRKDSILIRHFSGYSQSYNTLADTTYYIRSTTYKDCYDMVKETKFIGFKCKVSDRFKLGWIKLQHTIDNKFIIFETAIQN